MKTLSKAPVDALPNWYESVDRTKQRARYGDVKGRNSAYFPIRPTAAFNYACRLSVNDEDADQHPCRLRKNDGDADRHPCRLHKNDNDALGRI